MRTTALGEQSQVAVTGEEGAVADTSCNTVSIHIPTRVKPCHYTEPDLGKSLLFLSVWDSGVFDMATLMSIIHTHIGLFPHLSFVCKYT